MAKKGSKKEKTPKQQQGGGKKAKVEQVFCNSEDCFEYAPAGQKYCGPCQPKAEPVLGRETSLRTHNCGQLRASDIGKEVQLIGSLSPCRTSARKQTNTLRMHTSTSPTRTITTTTHLHYTPP